MQRSAALALVVLLGLPGWAWALDPSSNVNADPAFDPNQPPAFHPSSGVASNTLSGFYECKDLSDGKKVRLRETTLHVLVNKDLTTAGTCVAAIYFDNQGNAVSCAAIELTPEDLHQYNVCKYIATHLVLPDGTLGAGQPPATGHVQYFLAESDGIPDPDPDPLSPNNDCLDAFNILPLPGGNPMNVISSSGTYGWVKNVAYDFKEGAPGKTKLKVFNMAKTNMPNVFGGVAPLAEILTVAGACLTAGLNPATAATTREGAANSEQFDDVRQIDLSTDYVDVLPDP